MAAPKTVKTYDLNGTLKDFPITFEYLARKFITVTLIGTDRRELILNTDYRFSTPTQITTLRSAAWGPADNYELIEIRRLTSATDRLVDFADGSILRAFDLNTSQIQSLHIAEEARDLTADTIGVNDEGNLDARAKRIVNVADPVDPGDVVTLRYEQDWAASTLNNKIAAETARDATFVARDLTLGYRDTTFTYQSNALAYRDASLAARDLAKDWASKAEDSVVSGGLYSSYHYSRKADAQAVIATTQASTSTAQAAIATTQASTSTAQAVIATTQADRAQTEADRAQGYANGLNLPSASGNGRKYLRQKSDASGLEYVQLVDKVYWSGAYGSSTGITVGQNIIWDIDTVLVGGVTKTNNNTRVYVPVSGNYRISTNVLVERSTPGSGTSGVEYRIAKNMAAPTRAQSLGWLYNDAVSFISMSFDRIIPLVAGDYLMVFMAADGRCGPAAGGGQYSAWMTIELITTVPA